MAIKSMQINARPPIIGRVHKGGPKPQGEDRPGADLDHFRIESTPEVLERIREIYGDKPRQLRVLFIEHYPADIYDPFLVQRGQTGIATICDSVNIVKKRVAGRLVACDEPCEFDQEKAACPRGCKSQALKPMLFYIRGVERAGVFAFNTTSWTDNVELQNNLAYAAQEARKFRAALGAPPDASLLGVEFILGRDQRTQTVPSKKSPTGKAKVKRWLCYLEISPDWIARVQEEIRKEAYGENLALPEPKAQIALSMRPTEEREPDEVAGDLAGLDADGFDKPEDAEEDADERDEEIRALALDIGRLAASLKAIKEVASTTQKAKATQKEPLKKLTEEVADLVAAVDSKYKMDNPASFDAAVVEVSAALEHLNHVMLSIAESPES